MDRYERILALHRRLKTSRYPVGIQGLMQELACSRATLYRDIATLRHIITSHLSGELISIGDVLSTLQRDNFTKARKVKDEMDDAERRAIADAEAQEMAGNAEGNDYQTTAASE